MQKKFFAITAALLAFIISGSAADKPRAFNPESDANFISKYAVLDKPSATIKFKSERNGWNHMAYLFKGAFKPHFL